MECLKKIENLEKQEIQVKEQLCQIASLTYNIEDLKAVRESLLNVNKELELRLNDQEKLLHRTNEEIKVTHDKIECLQNEKKNIIENMQEAAKNYEDKIINKDLEVKKKSQQVQEMSEKISFLENQILKMKENNSILLQRKLAEENKKLRNALCEKEDVLAKALRDFEQLEQLSAETQDTSKNKIQNLESEKVQLNSKLLQKEKSESKLKDILNHQEVKIKCLQREMNKKEQEIKDRLQDMSRDLVELKRKEKELSVIGRKCLEDFQGLIISMKFPKNYYIPIENHVYRNDFTPGEVYERILNNMKHIVSAINKNQQDQMNLNQDLCSQIETLNSEIKKNKVQIQQEKGATEKLERINEELKASILSLQGSLQKIEDKLKQEANGHEKRIRHLTQQVKLCKREIESKDSIISNIMAHFNCELSISTQRLQDLWNENESQIDLLTTSKMKEKELEQSITELKSLLKESHQREEQAREFLREKHTSQSQVNLPTTGRCKTFVDDNTRISHHQETA